MQKCWKLQEMTGIEQQQKLSLKTNENENCMQSVFKEVEKSTAKTVIWTTTTKTKIMKNWEGAEKYLAASTAFLAKIS